MLTMRATPKTSEKPTASSAYTPPFTSPVTRMSCNKGASARWHLERLHPLHLRRPEWHLLAVLPLHRDARSRAHAPYRVMALVEREDRPAAHVLHLLERRHQLVGADGLLLLDRALQEVDRVVGRRGVGGRLLVALLVGAHESHRLRRHLHLGVGVEGRDELRLTGRRLPELLLLALDVDAPR